MTNTIDTLRDDFADNVIAFAWGGSGAGGSAAVAETGGQAVLTLPNATAGAHLAQYSTLGTYDITGDAFVWNIGTMVATGVAATAYFQLLTSDLSQQLLWRQVSNAITARTIVAGVDTQLFTATWSAATYKYLRIRESAGTIYWDSSTNGTSWTNRASVANPFIVTSMVVQFAVTCGNVASPGSLRLDDVNLILPALSSAWNDTTVEWPLLNRYRVVTLAASSGQGYIAIASECSRKADGTPDVLTTPRYFSGPIGSSSGGYNQLTEYATQAAAQAMAVNLPADNRWDLPEIVECRFIRLYHRSTNASNYILREYYPRRLVQADDIEAETIRTFHLGAGIVTADKIFVLELSAITADMGTLTAGLITGANIQTSVSGARVLLSSDANGGAIGYDATDTYDPITGSGTYQILWSKTDGCFYWSDGLGRLDDTGITITAPATSSFNRARALNFVDGAGTIGSALYGYNTSTLATIAIEAIADTGQQAFTTLLSTAAPTFANAQLTVSSSKSGTSALIWGSSETFLMSNGIGAYTSMQLNGPTSITNGGLDVGTATGAGTGEISTSGSLGVGVGINSITRLYVKGATATSADYAMVLTNGSAATLFAVRDDNRIGFFGAGVVAKPTVTGSRAGNAALASLLTSLASLGLVTDSSSA